ncbi:MAG TPA: AAA family ATPase, partial [Microbacteriaceae bacterium]|nr:AAA family ATPase [Microbacteriaceae bacterium]
MSVGGVALVGRADELATLDAALDAADAGRFQALVISGDAGIGKTRLIDEFARRHAERALVLVGHAEDPGSGPLPFAVVGGFLRDVERALTGARPPLPADVEHQLDALRAGHWTSISGEVDSARLLGGFVTLVDAAAAGRPIVIVLDDLQWSDPSTLEVMRFLVPRLGQARLLVVLAFRSDDVDLGHPLSSLLAEFSRSRWGARLELPPLDPESVGALAESVLGRAILPDERDTILQRSDGVPFYVEEVAVHLGEPLPPSLREILMLRYVALGEPARSVLRVVAEAGGVVPHDLVATVVPFGGHALDVAVREALAARVLVSDPDGYRFRHALMREAVREELVPGERARIHAAVAAVEEDRRGDERDRAERIAQATGATERLSPRELEVL